MRKEKLTFDRTAEGVEAVAREVLKFMPAGWTMTSTQATYYFTLTPPSGDYHIGVDLNDAPNRYNAHIEYHTPRGMSDSEVLPENSKANAGTNFQRGPEPIAQSIIKNLIPIAEEQFPIIAENVKNIYEIRAARRTTCDKLASLCDTTYSGQSESLPIYGKHGIWQIRVNDDGTQASVDLRNSYPVDKVIKLIEFMRDNGFGKH